MVINIVIIGFIIIAAVINDIARSAVIFAVVLILAVVLKKADAVRLRTVKRVSGFAAMTFLAQMIFNSSGEIVFSLFMINITKESILSGSEVVIKIFTMTMLTWFIDYKSLCKIKIIDRYTSIVSMTVRLMPEIMPVLRSRAPFRKILKRVYRNVIIDTNKNKAGD